MFDGSFKSRRTINLGGNKQQVDKQRLLRQAQEERRAREAERLRLRSAERIQAWYRGRKAASNLRQELRTSWDLDTAQLEAFLAANASEAPSTTDIASSIHQVTRKFLLFFRPAWDHARLIKMCNLLLSDVQHHVATIKTAILPFVISGSEQDWGLLLARLLRLLSSSMRDCGSWPENESRSLVTLLDTLATPASYSSIVSNDRSKELSQSIIAVLVNSDVFPAIYSFMEGVSADEKDRVSVVMALNLAEQICKSYQADSERYRQLIVQFTRYIMTIPLLPNRIAIEALTSFTSRLPLDAILQQLAEENCQSVPSWPQKDITALLANILAFGHGRVNKMNMTISNAYVRVLTSLLGMIPTNLIEAPVAKPADEDEDQDDAEWRLETVPGSAPQLSSNGRLCPRMLKWLSLAHDSNHLNNLFAALGSSTGGNFSEQLLSDVTQLLLNLITLFPSQKINLLSSLMFFRFNINQPDTAKASVQGISIIRIALDTFFTTKLYQQLSNAMQMADTPARVMSIMDPQHTPAWGFMAIIAELYCQILVTMGDDEFHDSARNPIPLSSVVTLSTAARDASFLLWWHDNALDMSAHLSGSKNLTIGYLRDIITKLTRQLHARDSRRSFCPKDHWLAPMPLDMASFKRAVVLDEENLGGERNGDVEDEMGRPMGITERANRRLRSTQLARLSPRLGVLNNIPFVIRFEDRVAIFRAFVESDRDRTPWAFDFRHQARAVIRRDHVFEDGFDHLNPLGSRLKGRIAISFVDQYGIPEAGIDGGGVFKEFLTSLVHEAFDARAGLFMNTSDQLLYPNPQSFAREPRKLQEYEFLGRILGKALYEGILIDAAFAGFFLSKCLGQMNYLDDLPSLDPDLYKGLMFLKNYEGNFEDLALYFTVDDEELGVSKTRELIPGGSNIQVTRQNRIRYIYLMAHYRLNYQIEAQCRAFFHGLQDLIDPKWLWMFNQQELQVMLGGAQTAIQLDDLKQNVVYSNFSEDDPTIKHFWSVVEDMSEEDRRLLIKFVTSCARPPLLGFKELNPKMCIRNAGDEEDRLPTSSTCMNLLKLPAFKTRKQLKEKLMYAIHAEAGFDLS
ncbi:hypothetical protein BGW41_001008 [Actinomortierella wolfii]|nr:hypothetical protein BGW41_001008 [Actinomortierella wolfii]